MTLTKLFIDGEEEKFTRLSYSDYVDRIGSWIAKLNESKEMDGYCTVSIEEDGEKVFQGMLIKPSREVSRQGPNMDIGGPEWTARLMHSLTPGDTLIEDTVPNALTALMVNSPFSLGEVDSWTIELDPTVYDTSLEFLDFTYSTMCLVYDTVEEVESQVFTGTAELPPPSLRCSFWYGGTTKRFYIIFYDQGNTKLQYTFSTDGSTWSAAADFTGATPAATEGDGGTYGVYWDGTNVHILVDDGANIDYWTGTINDGSGVITLAKTTDDIDAGNLVCGPVPDNSGHIWCCIYDGANYILYEYVAGWTAIANGANEVKQIFPLGSDGDMIVIEWDSGEGDLEEYHWDRSAASYAHYVDIVTSISGTSIGYVCGFWDYYYNLYLYWEDVYAGGDANIMFSWRMLDETTWETAEKVVDDDYYQSPGNFSVGGDDAGNTYLYYQRELAGGDTDMHLIRRFEETHEATVEIEPDILNDGHIQASQRGLGQFGVCLNGGADVRFILLSPEGITTLKRYDKPWFFEDHEEANAYTGSFLSSGCSIIATDTSRPFSGSKNMKATIPAGTTSNKNCVYYKGLGTAGSWGSTVYLSARNVRWNVSLDVDDKYFHLLSAGRTAAGIGCAYAGVYRTGDVDYWAVQYFSGAGLTWSVSAVEATPAYNHFVELGIFRDNAAGWVRLWVDGVLVVEITGADTQDGTDRTLDYARFGAGYADSPADSDLIVYMDDCRVNHKRLGNYQSGTLTTDLYTATVALEQWGTLDSDGEVVSDNSWSILDNALATLLSNLSLPSDLEDEGLSATETDIYIRATVIQRGSTRSYIYQISISEKGTSVSIQTDYENVYTGLGKVADAIGAEYKLDYDDLLNFVTALGEDKSDLVKFFTARAESLYPETRPNLQIVSRNPDWGFYANCIRVIGGSGGTRYEATARDEDEVSTMSERLGGNHNGEIWYVVRDPDSVSTAMAQNRAIKELDKRKVLYERVQGIVLEYPAIPRVVRGDTVTLVDRWTELDSTARIVGLTVNYDGKGNKTVSLELIQRMRASDLPRYIGRIDDLMRYATK